MSSSQRIAQRERLIVRVRNQTVQLFARIAESGGELIERGQNVFIGLRADFLQPDVAQLSRERSVLLGLSANDVDEFKPGAAIKAQVF